MGKCTTLWSICGLCFSFELICCQWIHSTRIINTQSAFDPRNLHPLSSSLDRDCSRRGRQAKEEKLDKIGVKNRRVKCEPSCGSSKFQQS